MICAARDRAKRGRVGDKAKSREGFTNCVRCVDTVGDGLGVVGLCVNVVTGLTLIGAIAWELDACFASTMALTCLSALFTLAWFIIGIVIIARSHGDCVSQSTSLGVMAMIMVVLQGISVCCRCGGSSTAAQ